ncbi:MAG: hypothetical protein HZA50_09255 [Planctomycetes bacterium]|nr:hypothetical protein [Planctomycetota bacterium]
MEKLVEHKITGKLGSLKLAIRTRIAAEGIGWVLAAAVAVIFITLGMDYLLRLEKAQRMLVMLAWLCGLAYLCWRRLVSPMFVPMNRSDLALLVENRFGQLGDRLISAIQFETLAAGAGGMSRAMILKVAHEANRMAGALNFGDVVRSAGAKRSGSIALGALLILAALGLWKPHILGLWFDRNIMFRDTPWPQDTYLLVQGGPDFSVVRGDDLKITVAVTDNSPVVPQYIVMHTRSSSFGDDWIEERLEQSEAGGRTFVKIFQNVPEEFQFYVTGGDDSNDRKHPHKVSIIEPPTLIELEFPSVVYPGYMRRPEGVLPGGTSVQKLPVGCRVSVRAVCNKPLKHARLVVTTENIQGQQSIVQALRECSAEVAGISGRADRLAAADAATVLSTADKLKGIQKNLAELAAKQQATGKLATDNYIGRMDDAVVFSKDGQNVSRPAGRTQIGLDCQAFSAMLQECSAQAGKAALGVNDKAKLASDAPAQLRELSVRIASFVEIASAIYEQMSVVPLRIRGAEKENSAGQSDAVLAKYLGGTGPVKASGGGPSKADSNSPGRDLTGKYCIEGVNRPQVANLKFFLTDESGYTSRKGQEFQVQVQPDQPPTVQLFRPGLSLFGPIITPEAELPLQVQADDEYGVSAIQFHVAAKPADGAASKPVKDFRPINQPITPGEAEEPPRNFKAKTSIDLAKWEADHKTDKQMQLDLKAGDTVEIRADAKDNMPGEFGGPNVASSQVMAFQVIAKSEFIRLLIAKQKEAQKEFLQIIEMQASAYGKTEDVLKLLEGATEIDQDSQRKLDESAGLQQTIASQLTKSAGTFKAIMDEMIINRVGAAPEQQAMADIVMKLTSLVAPPDANDKNSLGPCQKVNRDLAACKEIYKDPKAVAQLAEASQSVVAQQKALYEEMGKIMKMMKQVDSLMETIRVLDELIEKSRKNAIDMELIKRFLSGGLLEDATSRPATAPASAPAEKPLEPPE